jgi:hypothetical protein
MELSFIHHGEQGVGRENQRKKLGALSLHWAAGTRVVSVVNQGKA